LVNIGRIWRNILGLKASPAEFVGYENLVRFIRRQALLELEGDLIEIGAYMGGGTVKLARLARQHGKKLYVIDTFDPASDKAISKSVVRATEVYQAFLEGRSMWEVYREATRRFRNVITIIEDSRKVMFDEERKTLFREASLGFMIIDMTTGRK
jgi:cephalosporin hydroxylase